MLSFTPPVKSPSVFCGIPSFPGKLETLYSVHFTVYLFETDLLFPKKKMMNLLFTFHVAKTRKGLAQNQNYASGNAFKIKSDDDISRQNSIGR